MAYYVLGGAIVANCAQKAYDADHTGGARSCDVGTRI